MRHGKDFENLFSRHAHKYKKELYVYNYSQKYSLRELIRGSDVLKNKRTALEAKIEVIKVKREEIMAKIRTIKSKLEEKPKLEEACRRQNDKVKQLKNNAISA